MKNPKTTIAGYLILAGALATLAAHLLTGNIGQADVAAVLAAVSGLGLIGASDGGH